MGDSDDEYNQVNNSSSGINLNSSNNNNNNNTNNNNPAGLNNSYNNNNNKKNRDKFYRERDDNSSINNNNNYQNNPRRDWSGGDRGGRSSSNNDVWKNRNMNNSMPAQSGYGSYQQQQQQQQRMNTSNNNNNNDYPRKYTGATTTTTSPANFDSNSPPYKRNKKEWDSNDSNRHSTGGSDSYSSNNYHHNNNNNNNKGSSHNHHHHHSHHHSDYKSQSSTNAAAAAAAASDMPDYPTQPPFLSFKLFLQQQDDNISDEEAIRKYNDYKTDFKKTQINNFFLEHKEEDWFKQRYHPDENFKRRNEQNQFILNRLDVFMDLMQNQTSWFDAAMCEMDHSKDLIKFLDAVVIKLEGGGDQDLKKCLESNSNGENNVSIIIKETKKEDEKPKSEEEEEGDEGEVKTTTTNGNGKKEHDNDEENNNNNNNDEAGLVNKKRKSEDSGSESGAYTDSDDDQNNDNNHHKKKKNKRTNNSNNSVVTVKHDLHKTSSIFMRNLAPSVTKQDLELLCKSYDGFKRVALSDPGPERGFFRRGWITFESSVDVKKICWSLQNTKIKDFNPGAIVNRELTNRIRPIPNLVSHHKSVIKNDIKLAMKIVQSMDKRWNLWQDNDNDLDESLEKQQTTTTTTEQQQTTTEATDSTNPATNTTEGGQTVDSESKETANLEKEAFSKLESMGVKYLTNKFKGTNPLLNNITDYLVDEANAEEEELLSSGLQTNSTKSDTTNTNTTTSSSSSFDIEIDRNYSRVLDKLVLYLRIVHSIDFYNSTEYQQEDSMPNRCGIMFVRPALPLNAAAASLKITQDEINQYTQQFELKMKPFIEYKDKLDLEQARKLGIKEREEEVQKFIKTNTQELAADRWLCPLSGKKFKGPEFIRKHLFYKHMDKIVEVKKEVEYFNNYVFDLKRPQLPEHPSNNKSASSGGGGGGTNQSNSNSHSSSYQSHSQSNYNNSNQQQQQQQHQSNYSTANIQPGLLASPNMMSSGYSMQNNRQMSGGWQGSYNMPNNNMMSGYGGSNFGGGGGYSNMMGGGGQYAGFKKPGFDNRRGIGSNNSREMIQYKDLDAPEDN